MSMALIYTLRPMHSQSFISIVAQGSFRYYNALNGKGQGQGANLHLFWKSLKWAYQKGSFIFAFDVGPKTQPSVLSSHKQTMSNEDNLFLYVLIASFRIEPFVFSGTSNLLLHLHRIGILFEPQALPCSTESCQPGG